MNIPTDTVGSSSVYSFEFPPPAANDRFIFMNMDISECFHNFQLAAKAKINQDPMSLTLEEHVQHILALSGILLLKPARTHADLHQHTDLDICHRLLDHILTSHLITRRHVFPSDIKDSVGEIVKRIVDLGPLDLPTYTEPYTRMYASREIMTLMEGVTLNQTNRILLVIRNMVECLPRHIIGDGPQEIETSISDDEKGITTRPDASINIVRGASLGQRLGYGEVKPQYQASNHKAIAKDLIRVGHLAKDASDKYQTRMIFGLVIVGNHGTFYVLRRAQEYLYLMCEIEHVQLPVVLGGIPLFLAQLGKVMNIVAGFAQTAHREHHTYDHHPFTLADHKLLAIIDSKTSRKRKSITSHYTH
ncbi:hypothetical protein RMATCC62417_00814 [Rhizopus microsporus]|nr:hypothetical protein RMATCC62417_00814 [Rhizopus microsporus]